MQYEVHHIRGRTRSDGHDIPENLINLCVVCHKRAHGAVVDDKPPITANDLKAMLELDLQHR